MSKSTFKRSNDDAAQELAAARKKHLNEHQSASTSAGSGSHQSKHAAGGQRKPAAGTKPPFNKSSASSSDKKFDSDKKFAHKLGGANKSNNNNNYNGKSNGSSFEDKKKPGTEYGAGKKLHDQSKGKGKAPSTAHDDDTENGSESADAAADGEQAKPGKLFNANHRFASNHKEAKLLRIERKAHTAPHFELIQRAKRIWETLRQKRMPSAERQALADELMGIVTGHMNDIIFKHDAVRVIQCCIKFGNEAQRDMVFQELKSHLLDILRSKYGKFVVSKMLKYGSAEHRNHIINVMTKMTRTLIRHRDAADLVDTAYSLYANAAQRAALVADFYGPQFLLFKTSPQTTLKEVIDSHPELESVMLTHLKQTLTGCLDKGTIGFSLVHRALLDLYLHGQAPSLKDMSSSLNEAVIDIVHTREGAHVSVLVIRDANAKDRKTIIKSMKSLVKKIGLDEHGFAVLLALFDMVDDTVLVSKAVLSEIQESLPEFVESKYGFRVLQYLLAPRSKRYIPEHVLAVLAEGDGNPNSKKDTDVRREELRRAILPSLVAYATEHVEALSRDPHKLPLIQELVSSSSATELAPFYAALVAECLKDGEQSLIQHANGHRMVRQLILSERVSDEAPSFASQLFSQLSGQQDALLESNHGLFVASAFVRSPDAAVAASAKTAFNKHMKALKAKSTLAGAKVLIESLEGKAAPASAEPTRAAAPATPAAAAAKQPAKKAAESTPVAASKPTAAAVSTPAAAAVATPKGKGKTPAKAAAAAAPAPMEIDDEPVATPAPATARKAAAAAAATPARAAPAAAMPSTPTNGPSPPGVRTRHQTSVKAARTMAAAGAKTPAR
ncbi:hypothetical protein CAOG_02161 [Capsaspora owczarzaki ATCC 30864]|uniref:PUM-HD domain-containing protein n=1 Tax=Capsaspora owczarzaki (strain ATCC 30864) TaxID=595528 RepID=A0A0D2WKR3_CAPO3|nr:hypothetical protein CAOG_02161 [Capsaspora owczarzaki ATCC 30864]KJE90935.1 hypothetical protein CAOG_002161 [Capsaspora owczarzaki ATCC 30864]|eukprot:XP_004348911.2 hypothetical protein CAOG_02161 [Capsaspora owczarzaki ATCC 30864]